jgi:hypothetical protein
MGITINNKCRPHRSLLIAAIFLMLAATSALSQTVEPESQAVVRNNVPITKALKPTDKRENSEIDLLKAQLAAQQDELTALRIS